MSKSIPTSHHLRTIGRPELARMIAIRLCISETTANRVLEQMTDIIAEQLIEGNAINLKNLCTFHLRRRNYSEERRRKFAMGHASLPEFCYYPYAEMSQAIRKRIAENKYNIAQTLNE